MDANPSNATANADEEKFKTPKATTTPPRRRFWTTKYGKIATCCFVLVLAAIVVVIVVPTVLLTHMTSNIVPPPPPASSSSSAEDEQPPPPARQPPLLPQDHNPDDFPPALPDPFNNSARANVDVPPLSEPFPYGEKPIRGINLGGWLVLEPFITPSLFEQFSEKEGVVDEWTLCAKLGPHEAYKQLQRHYETFITEEDFKKIAEMGFDHVRIPTGHWAVNVDDSDEPFVPKLAWHYLLRAIQWARKYGLRVMVELHTAPGSQNGWNHSGKYGVVGWLNGTHGQTNADRTLDIVKNMTTFFSKPEWNNVAPIFGVVNEPAIFRINKAKVQKWYRESYHAIRNESNLYLTYHEGFIGLDSWDGFFDQDHYKKLFLEIHMYLMFDQGLVSMLRDQQAAFPCHSWRETLEKSMKNAAPTMVGEFSLATNDCGKYLNGIGIGNRYEGTYENGTPAVCPNCSCAQVEDWRNWSSDYKKFLKSFIEHQMDAFERSSVGWFFWTYKTENHVNPHWDYLLGWEQGWIPRHVSNRTYSCE